MKSNNNDDEEVFDEAVLLTQRNVNVPNSASVQVMQSVAHAMVDPACHIESICLSGGLQLAGAQAFAQALQRNGHLQVLTLVGPAISRDCLTVLLQGLALNTTIKALIWLDCDLDDEQVLELATSLRWHPSLLHLFIGASISMINEQQEDLQDDDQGHASASSLASLFAANNMEDKEEDIQELSVLFLDNCSVDSDGALALGRLLELNTKHLQVLSLRRNSLQNSGITAVARGLAHNQHVKVLDLSNSELGDEGAVALSDALRTNRHLQFLCLSWNYGLSRSGLRALVNAMAVNTTLVELDVQYTMASVTDAVRGYSSWNPLSRRRLPQSTDTNGDARLTTRLDRYLEANRALILYKTDQQRRRRRRWHYNDEPRLSDDGYGGAVIEARFLPYLLGRASSHPPVLYQFVRENCVVLEQYQPVVKDDDTWGSKAVVVCEMLEKEDLMTRRQRLLVLAAVAATTTAVGVLLWRRHQLRRVS